MKIGIIIQARSSSTRLPGKIFKKLPFGGNLSVLDQVIKRVKRSKEAGEIIIATTEDVADKSVVEIADKNGVKWFRGSKYDVLARYYLAAKENNIDIVVRVTSDCPCIDSEIIDLVVSTQQRTKSDYVANCLERSYPHGLDTEVFTFDALSQAYKNAKKDHEREHVTPYICANPDIFQIKNIKAPKKLFAPEIRVTIDLEEDYVLLCAVFDYLYTKKPFFGANDLIGLFKNKPWLKLINKKIVQKKILNSVKEEVAEAVKILDLQDLKRAKKLLEKYA